MSRWERTGRIRLGLVPRFLRKPLLGLEVEFCNESVFGDHKPTRWKEADLEYLSETRGFEQRSEGRRIRFRAFGGWHGYRLVMQVCTNAERNRWRDAHVEDLGDFVGLVKMPAEVPVDTP